MDRRELRTQRVVWNGLSSQRQDDPGQVLWVSGPIKSSDFRRSQRQF